MHSARSAVQALRADASAEPARTSWFRQRFALASPALRQHLASRQSSVVVFLQLTCGVQANVKIVRSGGIFMHNRFNSHTIVHPEHAATAGAHCFACLAVALCQASSELCTTPKPAVHATKTSPDTRITLHTRSRGVTQYAPVSPGTLSIFVPAQALSKRRHGRASAIPERLCTSRRLVN